MFAGPMSILFINLVNYCNFTFTFKYISVKAQIEVTKNGRKIEEEFVSRALEFNFVDTYGNDYNDNYGGDGIVMNF